MIGQSQIQRRAPYSTYLLSPVTQPLPVKLCTRRREHTPRTIQRRRQWASASLDKVVWGKGAREEGRSVQFLCVKEDQIVGIGGTAINLQSLSWPGSGEYLHEVLMVYSSNLDLINFINGLLSSADKRENESRGFHSPKSSTIKNSDCGIFPVYAYFFWDIPSPSFAVISGVAFVVLLIEFWLTTFGVCSRVMW
jgi:hypothetical protein